MARRRGSAAPAMARGGKSPLSGLKHHCTTCRIPAACGCVRADAGMLEAGWAADAYAFGLADVAHQRWHAVARRGRVARRVGSMPVPLGKVPGCNGGPIARWSWCGHVSEAGTRRGRWREPVVAERGLRTLLGGGSHGQVVRTGFWRQMVFSWFASVGWRATTRHLLGNLKVTSPPATPLVAQRALRGTRAAPRPCLFW